MNTQVIITIIILIASVLLYSSRKVSSITTSLLIMAALYITKLVDAKSLFAYASNSGTLITFFMCIISGALVETGAAALIGKVMTYKAKSERSAAMRLMVMAMILSAFFSNFSAMVVVATFGVGMCQADKRIRLQKLMMGVAIGCMTGGMCTLIGTSGNVLVRTMLQEQNLGVVGFFEFAKIGVPLCIISLIYMYFLGYRLCPDKPGVPITKYLEEDHSTFDRKTGTVTLIVFGLVILAMVLESVIKVPLEIVAMFGIVILLITNVLSDRKMFSYVSWPGTFMFISLMTLAGAIRSSGTADLIADFLVNKVGTNHSPVFVVSLLMIIVIIITQFMSNGATAGVFYPIAISVAQRLGLNPVAVLMMVFTAASASYATPMATPGNTYMVAVAGYKFSDFIKVCAPLLVFTAIVDIVLCPIIWPV